MKKEKDKYSNLLMEGGLFFYGPSKGNFILPPRGYALWKNIQNVLDKKFANRGVKNVLLPTFIPLDLLEKEKKHIVGFSPECFQIEKIGEKKTENPLVLRPTSEVLFYDWYRQILRSYRQLPLLYNQWCSVFRAEKNTTPFFRNTEFLWQEGHTLHTSEEEARNFAFNILSDYQNYAENTLYLGVIVGKKTEREKFAGALETYTVECLLPDGQCLQFATSHYFGDNFCRLMQVKFQNKDNQVQYPFSTSWGTSTRAIGAITKMHADNWGIILPFDIAPVQIAFVITEENEELVSYYQGISDLLTPHYRCQLYNNSPRVNLNILQADKEGCPFKIILGMEELKNGKITLVRRDKIERKITVSLEINEFEKKFISVYEKYVEESSKLDNGEAKKALAKREQMPIDSVKKGFKCNKIMNTILKEQEEFQKNLYQKSADFLDKHTFFVDNFPKLEKKIKEGAKGLFLIPFCNNLNCEEKIKEKILSYSIRCISQKKKKGLLCLFCELNTDKMVYLGRSY